MKNARRNLSLRDADTGALDYARRLYAGLNGIHLEEGGEGGEGGGSGGEGGSGGDGKGDGGNGSGSGDGGGAGGGQGGSGDGKGDGKGYPDDTPLTEMTVEQREAYWKAQSRKHEQRAKERADYDDVKAKADRYDQLEREKLSEVEKAKAEGIDEGKKAALRESALKLVDAKIEAVAAAGGISDEQVKGAVEFLDRSRFLTDDNEVDADKVASFVSSMTPGTGAGNGKGKGGPDLGQGRRPGHAGSSATEKGRDEARRRFGDDKK